MNEMCGLIKMRCCIQSPPVFVDPQLAQKRPALDAVHDPVVASFVSTPRENGQTETLFGLFVSEPTTEHVLLEELHDAWLSSTGLYLLVQMTNKFPQQVFPDDRNTVFCT